MSSNGGCSGYHWSQGQYMLSNCSQESSTFFIILGFTMLVLVSLLFIIIVITCLKRRRARRRTLPSMSMALQNLEDDCIVIVDEDGQPDGAAARRNLDAVKCVIMAGEEKPTFIAHPVPSSVIHISSESEVEEEDEGDDDFSNPGASPRPDEVT